MKKIGRLLALALASASVFTLAACGGKKSSTTDSKVNKFTVMNVRYPESTKTYLTKGTAADASKEAGVKINWKTITTLEWGDKKGTVLGGGDLPDAFFGNNGINDSDIANNVDSFIPLEKYINKKTMPNLYKIMKKDPKMRAIVTNADGHIYSLPSRTAGRTLVGNALFINQKWLDKMGLKMPTTYQEFTDVSAKMVNGDANGDGKKNEYGLNAFTNLGMIPWGVETSSSTLDQWMNYNGKKVYFTPATTTFKKAIAAMHTAYQKGAIDPEYFTQDFTKLLDKINHSTGTITASVTYTPVTIGTTKDEYQVVPALVGVDGKKHAELDQDSYARNQFEVTTSCKNPAKLLSWVDKFYEPDNSIQAYYGPIGKTVKKNSDGTYTLLKDPTGKWVQDDFALKNAFRDWAPQYGGKELSSKIHFVAGEGDGLRQVIAKKLDKYTGHQYPMLSFTTDEQKELSSLQTDIDGYVNNKYATWVTKGGVDKDWNSYISQLNTMGLKRYLQIQNKALKRYDKTLSKAE